MDGKQMKICKICFRMMKEEDLKNHVKMHKKNQIIMLKKNRQRIFELEKELDLKRMKDVKEEYMKEKFIRKLGGYIRHMIDYSFRVFYKLFRMPIERYVKDNK